MTWRWLMSSRIPPPPQGFIPYIANIFSSEHLFLPVDEVEISDVVSANSAKLNLLKDLNIWICFKRIVCVCVCICDGLRLKKKKRGYASLFEVQAFFFYHVDTVGLSSHTPPISEHTHKTHNDLLTEEPCRSSKKLHCRRLRWGVDMTILFILKHKQPRGSLPPLKLTDEPSADLTRAPS